MLFSLSPLPSSLSRSKQKNGRGESSAALLSSQLWVTTFGVAGALNPERPGSRWAKLSEWIAVH